MTNDADIAKNGSEADFEADAGDASDASDASANGAPFTPVENHLEHLRIVEAVLFAASEPLDEASLKARLPEDADLDALLEDLASHYATRGINLVRVAGKWAFRTADDLAFLMQREAVEQKRLSRAALETLAIIAYHQPVTRAEIEEVRGVAVNKGTVDVLLETGWIRLRGRRRTPGRPVTYGTSDGFLDHFGLDGLDGLPGLEELKAAGLLSGAIPDGFEMPGMASEEDDGAEDEDNDEDFVENDDLIGDGDSEAPEWLIKAQDDPPLADDPAEFARALGDEEMGHRNPSDRNLSAGNPSDELPEAEEFGDETPPPN